MKMPDMTDAEKDKEIERLTFLHNLDHSLADQWQKANDEKDREIERLTEELDSHSWEISQAMAQQRIDKLWAENKRLERDILMLVRLCLSHGIISRGLACRYLGCEREDLDDFLKEDSDGRGEETA